MKAFLGLWAFDLHKKEGEKITSEKKVQSFPTQPFLKSQLSDSNFRMRQKKKWGEIKQNHENDGVPKDVCRDASNSRSLKSLRERICCSVRGIIPFIIIIIM